MYGNIEREGLAVNAERIGWTENRAVNAGIKRIKWEFWRNLRGEEIVIYHIAYLEERLD
jgi:hypothetical protein